MTAELLRDERWHYPGLGASVSTRRLRVWREPPGRLVAVITEEGDGTSAVNAAEVVIPKLQAEYRRKPPMEFIVHVPGTTYAPEEQFIWMWLDADGVAGFKQLDAGQTTERLDFDSRSDR
jgi:hypothetical protein